MALTPEEQAELEGLNRWMSQTLRHRPSYDPTTRRVLVVLEEPMDDIIRKGDRVAELERKAAL